MCFSEAYPNGEARDCVMETRRSLRLTSREGKMDVAGRGLLGVGFRRV